MQRPGQSLHRLVLSATTYNDAPGRASVITAHVVDADPEALLAVRVEPVGWATLTVLETTPIRRLGERVGTATTEGLTAVEAALAAVLDLG